MSDNEQSYSKRISGHIMQCSNEYFKLDFCVASKRGCGLAVYFACNLYQKLNNANRDKNRQPVRTHTYFFQLKGCYLNE
jgi:hypothetical protein